MILNKEVRTDSVFIGVCKQAAVEASAICEVYRSMEYSCPMGTFGYQAEGKRYLGGNNPQKS